MNQNISSYAQVLVKSYEDLSNHKYFKINFKKINSLGSAVKEISPSLKAIKDNLLDEKGGLYELANLVSDNKWSDITKDIENMQNAKIDLSHFGLENLNISALSPKFLLICGLLVSIEEALLILVENQNSIISQLKKDRESEIEGDLKVLNNFLKEYKHNYTDSEYCKTHVGMVLDIKRSSMQKIVFYQKEINELLDKKHKFVFGENIKHIFDKLNYNLSYYRLVVYIYAFSTFLETILNKNFEKDYLEEMNSSINTSIDSYLNAVNAAKETARVLVNTRIEKKAGNVFGSAVSKVGSFFSKKNREKEIEEREPEIEKILTDEVSILDSLVNHNCDIFISNIDNLRFIYSESSKILIGEDGIILI